MKESWIRCVTLICYISFQLCNKLLQKNLEKSSGGDTFVSLKFKKDMKTTNVTKIEASYVAPTVYVIKMKSEGCLCGSLDRTQSNAPDDFEYGGTL